jgi:GNAT superfamily N-acetyltransferase
VALSEHEPHEGISLPADLGERASLLGLDIPPELYVHEPDPESEYADSWHPVNLAALEERPPVQPTLGGLGLLYPGKRHVFSGPQESAKTLAAYACTLEVVRTGATAAIIDFEMGRWDARDRLRDLGATQEELARILYIEPSEPADGERILRLVYARPELVTIDAAAGAYDLQGLDDNKRLEVERFSAIYVREFWRHGIATLLLDHVVKNAENRGRYTIGSERKVGGADVHLGFEAITPVRRGAVGLYKITTHKDRGGFLQRGRLADMHLSSDPATHRISWEFRPAEHPEAGEVWRPRVLMVRTSEHLEQAGEPLTQNRIVTNVKGKDSGIVDALAHLAALGFVAEEHGPAGAKIFRHLRRYNGIADEATSSSGPSIEAPEQAPLPTSAPPLPAEGPSTSAPSAQPSRVGRGGEKAGEEGTPPTSAPPPEPHPGHNDDIPF